MPKRKDIKKILVIGAGPIIIGQACEFDYSGTQACKALKDEGYKVILVNDVSRFFRNKELGLYELNKLSSQNICVISVIENCNYGPYSNLVNRKKFRNLLERSEQELKVITERINNSVAFRKKRGDYFGVAPFGYKTIRDNNGKRILEESESEKQLIGLIYKRNRRVYFL